jgi:hypothetical protein
MYVYIGLCTIKRGRGGGRKERKERGFWVVGGFVYGTKESITNLSGHARTGEDSCSPVVSCSSNGHQVCSA